MAKPVEPLTSKKPRGRNGGRTALPEEEKREQANFYLPRWLLEAFKVLVPVAADRSKLIAGWVRAYVIAGGETDRLLMQSSVAVEVLGYLEATNAPQELIDKVESAIVARVFDDAKIAEGVTQIGESFIV